MKGWRDISSVFTDNPKSDESDTVTGTTGYGSRYISKLLAVIVVVIAAALVVVVVVLVVVE